MNDEAVTEKVSADTNKELVIHLHNYNTSCTFVDA